MTYSEIRKNEEVLAFIKKGNANLGAMGFTDHSEAHSGLVAERAAEILKKFGYPEKDIELVKIAGFMHDIGNAVNRSHHAEYGALLANDILKKTDLPLEDRVQIVSAIGLHDESTGGATDPISAALIIADRPMSAGAESGRRIRRPSINMTASIMRLRIQSLRSMWRRE